METSSTTRLTRREQMLIQAARELAALNSIEAFRQFAGKDDGDIAQASVLGECQYVLFHLAELAQRLADSC